MNTLRKYYKIVKEFSIVSLKRWQYFRYVRTRKTTVPANTVLEIDLANFTLIDKPITIFQTNFFAEFFQMQMRPLYYRQLIVLLDKASKDPNVIGLVVRVDAKLEMKGMAVIQELRNAVEEFKKQGKYCIAYADTIGSFSNATKTYYFASIFDDIFVSEMGMVSMSGLSTSSLFFKDLFDKLHIEPQFEQRKEYKSAMEPLTRTEFSPEAREQILKLLQSQIKEMRRQISEAKHVTEEQVDAWLERGIWSSKAAKEQKIISNIGFRDESIAQLKQKQSIENLRSLYLHKYPPEIKENEFIPNFSAKKRNIAILFESGTFRKGERLPQDSIPNSVYGESFARQIHSAVQDKAEGLIIVLDSPGGEALSCESIIYAMKKAKKAGIVIYVVAGNVLASAAYMIAVYADVIYANPLSIVGSIGVLGGKFNIHQTLQSIGVHHQVISTHKNATLFSPFDSMTEEQRKLFSEIMDESYSDFVNKVAENRKLTVERVEQLAKGQVYLGKEALELQLIDRLGNLNDALEAIKKQLQFDQTKETIQLQLLPKRRPGLSNFWRGKSPMNPEEREQRVLQMETSPLFSFASHYYAFKNMTTMHGIWNRMVTPYTRQLLQKLKNL